MDLAFRLMILGWCAGCASASLGLDGEAIPVDVDRVVWNEDGQGRKFGVIGLVEGSRFEPVWRLNIEVEDRMFENRRPTDLSRLPLGSRVYLLDPDDVEYRGRFGPLRLSQRGGGSIAGFFALPGEDPSLELEVAWTSWHVSDRRRLGGVGPDQGIPTNLQE